MGASTVAAAPVNALSAGAYRDSVGVQMHHSFTNFAYQAEPAENLAAGLKAVGIRHVRDNACLNTEAICAPIRAKMAALKSAFGPSGPPVDFLLLYSAELKTEPDRAKRDAHIERGLLAAQSAPLAGMVAGLEGVNEPDLKGTSDWQAKTLADDATATRLLAEPRFAALRSVPRLTPAMGHTTNTGAFLSSGWSTNRADTANFHPYPPAWGGPENGLTTPCATGKTALDCARSLSGSAAAPIASESGYSTAGGMFSQSWVSEKAQATYLPRLLLENFSRGVAKTYLYELIDLQPDKSSVTNGYGLWRSRRSGSVVRAADPKPAAWALSRLHARIGDLGAAPRSTPLDLTLRNTAGQTVGEDTIRRVLLQRADGTYALALWQPKSVFDNAFMAQRDRAVADVKVDVAIGTPTAGDWTATAFRPSLSGDATAKFGPTNRFTVPVGADVTLIDLRGSQSGIAQIPGDGEPLGLEGPEPVADVPTVEEPATPSDPAPVPATAPTPAPAPTAAAPVTDVSGAIAAINAQVQAAIAQLANPPAPAAAKTAPKSTTAQGSTGTKTKATAKAKAKAKAAAKAKAKAAKAKAKAKARTKAKARAAAARRARR